MSAKNAKFSGKKTVLTYTYLRTGARHLLETAESVEEGNLYTSMGSLVSTAFMLEAFLNHLGQQRIKYWSELERLSPRKKLNVLASDLKLKPDFGKQPYQSFKKVFNLRNFLAHGKTETLKDSWYENASADSTSMTLQPKWQEMCTPENARSCYEDAEKIVAELYSKAGLKGDPFALMAHGTSSKSIQ